MFMGTGKTDPRFSFTRLKSMSMANKVPLQASIITRGLYSWSLRLPITTSRSIHHSRSQWRPNTHSLVPAVRIHQEQSYLHSHSHESGQLLYDETIYALSTGSGRAGIAIIRVSGPACLDIYNCLCPSQPIPKPRHATIRTLYSPLNALEVLDSDALVLRFPAEKTVTGEDVLELHIHGGAATVKAVLAAIPRCSSSLSIRYAEPGEFTRRAFQNNRLDLAQVEALSDTLSAETEQQRRAAVRGNSGKLGRTYEDWRQQLIYARGELEALIDFSEDQHFDESPAELLGSVTTQVMVMLKSIKLHEEASHRGELLKRGIRISLIGPPNAGKSSLLNQIVGREASIVSPEAGTTRDIVEVSLDIRGYLCTFADTAGLRDDSSLDDSWKSQSVIGNIEREGIRRAKAKASESDVIIALAYCDHDSNCVQIGSDRGKPGGISIVTDAASIQIARAAPYSLFVVNKFDSDLYSDTHAGPLITENLNWILDGDTAIEKSGKDLPNPVKISCKDAQRGIGFDTNDPGNIKLLVDKLVGVFERMTTLPMEMEDLFGVTERQRQLLSACSGHLRSFVDSARDTNEECDIVLAAEHLRSAANSLSRITGRGEAGDVEEVLGVVFEKFCVGK